MSAWSQLEQLLTCAICLDRFRNPKLLPCQHTFCGEPCMEGLVDYARRQIKCPECRAEHRIPYNGVQSFPNNVTLTRFLDLHRGITGEEPEPLPSQMDRCGVCGEKSVCVRCAHCEKKVCDECRTAHLDILRREINRINVQVRRGLNKLTEHAQQAGKGSERLLVTSTQIRDEISESVRRFIKDLKDKESKLLADLDEFTQSESKNSEKLNEDLDMELQTISSNCELVEKHVTEDDDWTDLELMEYKEIFLKTLDFLRNMDPDTMDFSRKIKYIPKVDLDTARRNVTDFGEIKITQAPSGGGGTGAALSPSESSTNLALPNSNLMRSQSDHRLAAQFATRNKDPLQRSYLDVTGQGRYGSGLNSDSERERGNSPPGRRGERFGSVRSYGGRTENTGSSFGYTRGWERPGDSEYEPSNSSNFRSRFMRERIRERGGTGDDHSFDDNDSEISSSHRVRFQEEAAATVRPKLFDTEEMVNMRAPLSGLIKLYDSPHVMERLHQNEVKAKLKDAETKENENSNSTPMAPTTISSAPPRPAQRQISEDEIEKQKKQNQAAAAAAQPSSTTTTTTTGTGTPLTPKTTTTTTTTTGTNSSSRASSLAIVDNGVSSGRNATSPASNVTNRRIQAIQKEDARSIRSSNSDDGASSGPESGDVTCDDDTSSMNAPASALNQTTRRRIFASSHSSSSGGEATNGTSASVDYGSVAAAAATEGAGSGRTTKSSSQQQQQPMTATTNSYYQSPYYANHTSTRSSVSRYGGDESNNTSSYGSKNRRMSRDEDTNSGYGESINNAVPNSPPYYSNTTYGAGRRSSFSRVSTMDDDDGDNNSSGNSYESGGVRSYYNSTTRKPYQLQPSALATHNAQASDRHGSSGSTAAYYRQKLAKSKSSHAIAYDDSDDENNSNNNNPLSPTSSSFRSRFGFSSSATAAAAATTASTNVGSDTIERFASSTSSGRRTSRSGYTYRTREAKEPSPETEDAAGSVTQYLINKYGTRSNSSRPSMLSKSKSSHAIYGRSLSSSDDDTPTTQPTTPLLRRASRDTDSFTFKSSTAYGLTFPRQMYGQKRRMMMKIGSRGTNPGCFTWPRGVACAPDNSIVVADSSNHRVQVFDSTGRFQFEFGSYGSGEGEFDCLAGVTVNRIGHYIVSDRYNHRIQVFDASGRFLRAFGTEGRSDGKFSYPWGISTDALGFIYVCDKENHRIQVFQSDGTFVGKFGSIGSRSGMLEHPHYIAVSNTNRIVVSDSNNHRIQIFDVNGRSLSTFGQEGSAEGQFKFPRGVAVDENGFIIVGDSGNNRIQIFNPDGTFLKSFGSWGSGEGEFKGLEGVAISSTGNILVCDRENHRIQIF